MSPDPIHAPVGHLQRLDLVRHAESAGNVANNNAHANESEMLDLAIRDMDVPLSERGEQQALALAHWLAPQRPDSIISSPYKRAVDTATIAANAAGITAPIGCDERLREREFGILDRLTRAGIEARHPDQAAARAFLGKMYHRPPGGESWVDVAARVRSFHRDLRFDQPGAHVIVVAHQAVILLFRYVLENFTEAEVLAIDTAGDIANAAVTTYLGDGTTPLELHAFNDRSHLPAELHSTRPDVPAAPR